MGRVALGEMRLGRASEEDVREEEERQAHLAALDSIAMPDLEGALPEPLGHEGEHEDAISVASPEASSATAHTLDGDWSDATTDGDAREPAPRSPSEIAALDEMAGVHTMTLGPEDDEAIQAMADRPEAQVRPDDSMSPDDDSPDALHAMQGYATDDDPVLPGEFRSPARALGTPTLPPPDERVDYVTDAESEDFPPTPGEFAPEEPVDAVDEPEFTYDPERAALDEMAGDPKPAPAEPEPMLDDGLPSEGDISGARARDTGLGFLRSLQNGLLGAIGRPRREMPHEAADLQERRDEGLQSRMQAKGVQRREEAAAERADAEAQQEASQAADASRRADESLGLRRDALDLQRRSFESLDETRDAARARADSAEERRETEAGASADPDSPASQAERLAFSVARQRLRGPAAAALDEALAAEGIDPERASAAQLRRANDIIRTIGVRGTGGGTGGAHGSPDDLIAQAVERGIVETPDQARALLSTLGARGMRTAIQQSLTPQARAREESGPGGTTEVLPGIYARSALVAHSEPDRIRTEFASARTQYQSLATVERIAQRYGARGAISPEVAGELGGPLSRLRSMVAHLQNTGVINPSEAPAIQAMLPDPTSLSQMTFGTLQGRLDSFRQELEAQMDSQLTSHGVDEAGIREAIRMLRGGHAPSTHSAAAPTSAGGLTMRDGRPAVRVQRPGEPHTILIPRAAWEASDEEDRQGAVEVR